MEHTKLQRQILNSLIDKYEKSKSYAGENKVNRSFSVFPTDFIKDYHSDYADVDKILDFEDQVRLLEEEGLVKTQWKGTGIVKISAAASWPMLYESIGREDKNTLLLAKKKRLSAIETQTFVTEKFVADQIEKVLAWKKSAYEVAETEKLVKICDFILQNEKEMLERELSIALLGDSKAFERHYKSKVCAILQTFADTDINPNGNRNTDVNQNPDGNRNTDVNRNPDENRNIDKNQNVNKTKNKEWERTLLEDYRIYANSSYLYFKGNGKIEFTDGYVIELRTEVPLAFNQESIARMKAVYVWDDTIMTVENLTSFNRMERKNEFYLYLGGYHNCIRKEFLKKLYCTNIEKKWLHFGDIDPDGFLILRRLREDTGIPFTAFMMGTEELKKNEAFSKPLEKNDIVKARNILNEVTENQFNDIMSYMLQHNQKLEQEIISWKLMNEK